MPSRSDPEHIAISKSSGLKIDWNDGHHSEYSLKYLRDNCPCATCAGTHGTPPAKDNPLHLYKPALKIADIEQVGGYALRIRWNDGHSTGIYSFDHFREICPCPECTALRQAS